MCDTHYWDYLQHSTLRFNLIDFQLNTDLQRKVNIFIQKFKKPIL